MKLIRWLLVLLWMAAPAWSSAQGWPTRPLTILVGFPPGGNVDGVARIVASALGPVLGQPVVIDNKPGAGGTIAANAVAKAPADGHTLFLMAAGHAASATLYRRLPYDSVDDFQVAGLLVTYPFTIAVHPASPYRSLSELLKAAGEKPDGIDYGTGGIGTGMHLVAELLTSRAGVRMRHVPYKGGTSDQLALMAGEIPVLVSTPSLTAAQHEAGKMRILAVTTRERYPGLKDVPTVAEAGVAEFDVRGFMMLAAPKGTPPQVVSRLNEALAKVLASGDVQSRVLRLGAAPAAPSSPAAAQRFLADEVVRWRKVITDARISLEN
ncbi:MAG TPA: tripartite tricarboxylate transporter substrate binding protein [Ramlibacter sp.]|nr:tripartite tricarboxylate transporter substrate binding protein [Ramlibacter sp.]